VRVLLVGGGGREHALAWKLAQSPRLSALYAAPGNPGIARHATCLAIRADAIDALLAFAVDERIDLTVIGPEAPLVAGIVDRFEAEGRRVFGPSARAAAIEGSKAFAKGLMARHGIPTARFRVASDGRTARENCRELGAPLVVKADGLAAGKGAIVCASLAEADEAIARCLERRAFGDAGGTVVVEEFMRGEEASFFALSNGVDVVPFGVAQDHKRVFDDDRGPNTGGMGAYAPAPIVDAALSARVMDTIVRPTIRALAAEGRIYRGLLYTGLMLTSEGPKVVEFNCRFGDPECQVVLPRLEDDLLPVLHACAVGASLPPEPRWRRGAAVCVVCASGGYPGEYPTGLPITGLAAAEACPGVLVFHAGTATRDGTLVTAGGRVLGVTALGDDMPRAVKSAYEAIDRICFEGMHFRKDIGRRHIAGTPGA
jgi:phosphoribosylamine--glycine ligase